MPGTGTLPRDNNNNAIPVASDCVFADATQTSPLAYNAQAVGVITLVRPANTYEFRFRSSTALRVSTTTATLATNYYVFDAGVNFIIPCGRATNVYLAGDAAAGTVSFMFHLV